MTNDQTKIATPEEKLWCIRIPGPDDLYAAPDLQTAKKMADKHNAAMREYVEKNKRLSWANEMITADVIEWPHDADESHAEALLEFDPEEWGFSAEKGMIKFKKGFCVAFIGNACKAAGWSIKKIGLPENSGSTCVWIDDAPMIVKLADDDGDSRMLQVACRIALHFEVIGGEWCAEAYSVDTEDAMGVCAYEPLNDDANKAARMAVLRCAGMIGEAME
jgi:hypothetical protein